MVEDRSSNRDSVIEGSSSAGSISEASGTHKVTTKIDIVTIDKYMSTNELDRQVDS